MNMHINKTLERMDYISSLFKVAQVDKIQTDKIHDAYQWIYPIVSISILACWCLLPLIKCVYIKITKMIALFMLIGLAIFAIMITRMLVIYGWKDLATGFLSIDELQNLHKNADFAMYFYMRTLLSELLLGITILLRTNSAKIIIPYIVLGILLGPLGYIIALVAIYRIF